MRPSVVVRRRRLADRFRRTAAVAVGTPRISDRPGADVRGRLSGVQSAAVNGGHASAGDTLRPPRNDAEQMADDDYSEFRTKAFLDSNMVLEALPLQDLPWSEIDSAGPMLLLVTPTVLKEVDAKKKDGRVGTRARDFNRLIAPIATTGKRVVISEGPPRVELAIATVGRIDWTAYDDLDPAQGDARIIAEALNAREIPENEKLVVSQDINPLFMAQRHGLRTHHAPETWWPKPDPGPLEKENVRLRQRLAEYEKTEPEFDIRFSTAVAQPQVYEVQKLSDEEASALVRRILAKDPKPPQQSGPLTAFNHDSSLDKRYETYQKKTVPQFVARYAQGLELMYGQVPFELVVSNSGNIRADNVIVEVLIIGGTFNPKPLFFQQAGPLAPRPKDQLAMPVPAFNMRDLVRPPVDRHEFQLDFDGRSTKIAATCEDFRHGQRFELEGVLLLDPRHQTDATVVVKVTAANLRGTKTERFAVPKVVRSRAARELVDLDELRYTEEPRMWSVLEKAIEKKDFNAFEWYPRLSDD